MSYNPSFYSKYKILPCNGDGMRVGILGGSFNPAHEGHLHISTEAIKRLGLDLVIWFVTPRNPLKQANMADSMEYRVQSARDMASSHPKIAVLDYEECLPNTYTITLVRRLRQMHPKAHFFYLMGADNMLQLPKWHKWRDIVNDMEVVVLDRNHHHHLLRTSQLCHIFGAPGEKWHFIKIRKNSLSSTEIREQA